MNIILLGPPGSGKGTQAELLSKKLNLYLFQTGDLARKLAKSDKRIKDLIDSGKLIPQEEMTMYVIEELSKNKADMKNILFDGFPRFISQYNALAEYLKSKGDDIDAVINLKLEKDIAVKRVSSRRICDKCGEVYNLITNTPPSENTCKCGGKLIQRADDNPESVAVRFDFYENNTKKLTDYLREKNMLTDIDANRAINVIQEEILQQLIN